MLNNLLFSATLITCTLIAIKIKKEDVLTIDGVCAIVGFGLGVFITSLNFIYSNNYLISLGPLFAISCLLYIRFRDEILTSPLDFHLDFSRKTLKIINILYWICISVALITYYQALPYYRPPIFFICISFDATLLGLELLASNYKDTLNIFKVIFKILLVSLILRGSAYFISPYPVGSDPWAHAEYIKYFLHFHHLIVPPDLSVYYCNYPIAHLFACAINLIANISIKESMFIIGVVLTLSTIFVYLIAKIITNNINIALLSMLLLNFADFHIQWSIEVIAMTFGIAIYAIIIYLIFKMKKTHQIIYSVLSILFLFVIIWTHTVSSFICLVSVISLYVGSFVYNTIYRDDNRNDFVVSLTFCMIFFIVLISQWMNPRYPFYEQITTTFVYSLTEEAKFLGRESTIADSNWASLINILGFLVFIFFGVIGSLYSISQKYANNINVSLILLNFSLFLVFFAFPVMGIRNILPYRWPAFIYVSFMLFVGIGFIRLLTIFKRKNQKIVVSVIILVISFFFMNTNCFTNMDSPIYGDEITKKRILTESEMVLSTYIYNFYDGPVIVDVHAEQIFRDNLKETIRLYYLLLTPDRDIDWNHMNDKLTIWRNVSLTRPVQVQAYGIGSRSYPDILLEKEFKDQIDGNFSCIFDTREARAYLSVVPH